MNLAKTIFAILLLFAACTLSQAQLINGTLTVTGTPNPGDSFTASGYTFQWTNGTPASATWVLITNSVGGDATNLFLATAALLPLKGVAETNSGAVIVFTGIGFTASASSGWQTLSFVTNGLGGFTNVMIPFASFASGSRTPVANQLVSDLSTYDTVPIATNIPLLKNYVPTNAIGGAVTLLTGGPYLNPVLTNGENFGNAFRSPGLGTGSEQFGVGAQALTNGALALGDNSLAQANSDIAIGFDAGATGGESIALGSASATAFGAVAVGYSATSGDTGTVAIGNGASANTQYGVAIGVGAATGGTNSVAIGKLANASYGYDTALGQGAVTTTDHQLMLGTSADFSEFPGGVKFDGTETNLSGWNSVFNGSNTIGGQIRIPSYYITGVANGNNTINPGTTNTHIVLSGPTGSFTNCSFQNGFDGRILIIENTTGQPMTFANESGFDSTAANRIDCPYGVDLQMTNANQAAVLVYNGSAARWKVVSVNGQAVYYGTFVGDGSQLVNLPTSIAGVNTVVTNGPIYDRTNGFAWTNIYTIPVNGPLGHWYRITVGLLQDGSVTGSGGVAVDISGLDWNFVPWTNFSLCSNSFSAPVNHAVTGTCMLPCRNNSTINMKLTYSGDSTEDFQYFYVIEFVK